MWSAIASAAGSLLGGAIGAISTHQENKFWANYNSPKNQMKRLSDAGLNPNLVYQNGNALTTASPVGDVGAQLQQGISNAGEFAAKALQNKLLKAQTANVESNTEKNQADRDKSVAEARKANAEANMMESDDYQSQYSFLNGLRSRQSDYYVSSERLNYVKEAHEQILKERSALEKSVFEKFGEKNAEQDLLYKMYHNQIEKTESEWRDTLLDLQYDLGRSGIRLNSAQMGKLANDIAVGNALIDTYNARVDFLSEQTKNEKERHFILVNDQELGMLKNEYQSIVNGWAREGINFEHYSTTDKVGPWSSTTTGDVHGQHKTPLNQQPRPKYVPHPEGRAGASVRW